MGLTERKFKARYNEHFTNFENRNPKNATSLSRKIWYLKDKNINYELKWKILQKAKPYMPGSRECQLWVAKIYNVFFQPDESCGIHRKWKLPRGCDGKVQASKQI